MSHRVRFLELLVEWLQELINDHRTTHGLWPCTVRRYQPFFNLKKNRQYWHYLYRRPQTEIRNLKSEIE
jgi:hypothetical protein